MFLGGPRTEAEQLRITQGSLTIHCGRACKSSLRQPLTRNTNSYQAPHMDGALHFEIDRDAAASLIGPLTDLVIRAAPPSPSTVPP